MTDDRQGANWPLPTFRFSVELGDIGVIQFQEVSGLDPHSAPLEYSAGASPVFSPVKMPGLIKSEIVTLKRGVFAKDNKFFEWFTQTSMNNVQRQMVTITLLDEAGKQAMAWTLANAWPVKVSAMDLMSDGNEVAIESLELAHEGLARVDDH